MLAQIPQSLNYSLKLPNRVAYISINLFHSGLLLLSYKYALGEEQSDYALHACPHKIKGDECG